ncbi:MAG: nitrate/nitrite transporter NrtS [Proteobacteria bacterium]|nr:nitrate/nitrite transporter NrtS [Pseudomonadota bacterium]
MKGQSKQPVSFINAALERSVVIRALKVTAVVGTILVAINHGDVFVGGGEINWFKIILTYMVPYAVATYAAAMQRVLND